VAALTTHQAARLLGVSLPTVVKWIKEGRLEAYKTPGGHRRIPEAELKQFCETFGMPFPGTVESVQSPPKAATRPRLILSSYEKDFADLIQDFMRIRVDASVEIVSSTLLCGMLIGQPGPAVLLIDQLHSNVEPNEVLALHAPDLKVVFLAESQGRAGEINNSDFFRVLSRPLELEELLEALRLALNAPSN
jgi:excisionase family DNA binding protein